MQGERQRGWARYDGAARLWQGGNRLAAATIEFYRTEREVRAETNVSALFLEQSARSETSTPSGSQRRNGPHQVTIQAQRFRYREAESRALFDGGVTAHNQFGVLRAPQLELFLVPGESGSEQVERAHAKGGVHIRQTEGEARGEEAEYKASEQTVALWGGRPEVVGKEGSSTTGARLTLYLVDGTILVESGEGARTVTRRPWTQ
jgi:lipopolysaccharide export system protein LptA